MTDSARRWGLLLVVMDRAPQGGGGIGGVGDPDCQVAGVAAVFLRSDGSLGEFTGSRGDDCSRVAGGAFVAAGMLAGDEDRAEGDEQCGDAAE